MLEISLSVSWINFENPSTNKVLHTFKCQIELFIQVWEYIIIVHAGIMKVNPC